MKCWLENWACNQIKMYFKHTRSNTQTNTRSSTPNWRKNNVLSNEHYSFSRRFVLCGGEKCAWRRWHTRICHIRTQSHRVCQSTSQPHTHYLSSICTQNEWYTYIICIVWCVVSFVWKFGFRNRECIQVFVSKCVCVHVFCEFVSMYTYKWEKKSHQIESLLPNLSR